VLTTSDALARSRTTAAHRRAVVCGDEVFDHATLANRCEQVVGALRGLGFDRGDRVAVLAANCHRYVEL
jgi:long-chain acyl-CoA synthetase